MGWEKYEVLVKFGKTSFQIPSITQLKVQLFVKMDIEILYESEVFYKNLYTSKIDSSSGKYDDIFIEVSTAKKLNQPEQDSCEDLLMRLECL